MKVVVLLSGGMDSTTLATKLVREGHIVYPLSINYGQRHEKELEYAKAWAGEGALRIVTLGDEAKSLLEGSSQTSPDIEVPKGHYAEETMKLTVVPNRNMMMLSFATAYAIQLKADAVGYAAHAGDHTIYPDCRPEFVEAMNLAMSLADWHKVRLIAPFLTMTKANIATIGAELGVDYSKTWSCYQGREMHCGKCGTCVERKEAFVLAGVEDPTEYER